MGVVIFRQYCINFLNVGLASVIDAYVRNSRLCLFCYLSHCSRVSLLIGFPCYYRALSRFSRKRSTMLSSCFFSVILYLADVKSVDQLSVS